MWFLQSSCYMFTGRANLCKSFFSSSVCPECGFPIPGCTLTIFHMHSDEVLSQEINYRVSQKFVPLISCTIAFDQNFTFIFFFIFLLLHEIFRRCSFLYQVHVFRISVTGMLFLFFYYHILQPLRHEVGYSLQTLK